MAVKVGQLQAIQDNIRQYRSWYDGSCRNLAILRELSLAFPEDGSVTAKNIEVRDGSTVTCSGTARDNRALLRAVEKLRAVPRVSDVSVGMTRGRSPMQFTFSFHWGEGGKNEH